MTHDQLVVLAANWLKSKHPVVITELATTGEEPDAIGWRGTSSTLIECKATRADFISDKNKMFRREPWLGIGDFRYFLTPAGLIQMDELPPLWGLLEVTGSKIRKVVEGQYFSESSEEREIGILLSTIRRIGKNAPACCSIRFYTTETKNRATLSVETE